MLEKKTAVWIFKGRLIVRLNLVQLPEMIQLYVLVFGESGGGRGLSVCSAFCRHNTSTDNLCFACVATTF